jgi:hypothetical protein
MDYGQSGTKHLKSWCIFLAGAPIWSGAILSFCRGDDVFRRQAVNKFEIRQGNVLEMLLTLPDDSIHCCITSPPYWGLRDSASPDKCGAEMPGISIPGGPWSQ